MSTQSQPPAAWKAAKPFVNGGLSGMMATCIIQPIDMVKVRIQLGAKGGPVSKGAGARFSGFGFWLRQRTF
jgi:solute carrier family 25 oxoglutarate transporter 11